MLKSINILSCTAIGAFLLLAGNASADVYTIEDSASWVNWPGYTSVYGDALGDPQVLGMDVTIENGLLTNIDVRFGTDTRVTFDSLFLNTAYTDSESWDDWNYFVHAGGEVPENAAIVGTAPEDGFYSVNDSYVYTLSADTTYWDTREGNPNGIASGSLYNMQPFTPTFSTTDGIGYSSLLTYNFTTLSGGGIAVDGGFFVAYSPWCANDVMGGGEIFPTAPVPEPATMLLFGTGLIGLAGQRLRRKKK